MTKIPKKVALENPPLASVFPNISRITTVYHERKLCMMGGSQVYLRLHLFRCQVCINLLTKQIPKESPTPAAKSTFQETIHHIKVFGTYQILGFVHYQNVEL